jgi:hypothetical protein
MKFKDAQKIMKAMGAWILFHEGVVDEPEPLPKLTLYEMLEANKKMEKANAKSNKVPMVVGVTRTRTIYMTIDERAIAALYVCLNYEPKRSSIVCANSKFVIVVNQNL